MKRKGVIPKAYSQKRLNCMVCLLEKQGVMLSKKGQGSFKGEGLQMRIIKEEPSPRNTCENLVSKWSL